MLDGAGQQLQLNGYNTIVQASNVTSYGEKKAWNSLMTCDCAGIIMHCDLLADAQLSMMMAQKSTAVLMNRLLSGYESRCVYVDQAIGGRLAARHLLEHGHNSIALITGPRKYKESGDRATGFTLELEQNGVRLDPELVYEGDFSALSGAQGLRQFLETKKPFSALFAHNDTMATGVMQACRDIGINVPADLSVIGFDDQECARMTTPKLTTVRQPKMEIGARAAQIVHTLVAGPESAQPLPPGFGIIIPTLVSRESVAPCNGRQAGPGGSLLVQNRLVPANNADPGLDIPASTTAKSRTRIGIVINKYGSSYYGRILDGAGSQLQLYGYNAIVQSSNVSTFGERQAWESLLDCDCDGLIVHSDALPDKHLASMMAKTPMAVLMNRLLPGFESRCVYVDQHQGGKLAGMHLLELGHTELAMITGPGKFRETAERTAGFIQALDTAGVLLDRERVVEGDFHFQCGVDAIYHLCDSGKPFTAVFVHNDPMAMGALEACRKLNIQVPEELSIIGYDDSNWARYSSPSLTTIRQPKREKGSRAAQIVHSLLEGAAHAEKLPADFGRILPELVVRESVLDRHNDTRRVAQPEDQLTSRESECLHWMAAGKTSSEIAIVLSISESTVNFHLKNILVKLNASNRVHAVAKALSRSLIEPISH